MNTEIMETEIADVSERYTELETLREYERKLYFVIDTLKGLRLVNPTSTHLRGALIRAEDDMLETQNKINAEKAATATATAGAAL